MDGSEQNDISNQTNNEAVFDVISDNLHSEIFKNVDLTINSALLAQTFAMMRRRDYSIFEQSNNEVTFENSRQGSYSKIPNDGDREMPMRDALERQFNRPFDFLLP